MYISYTAYYVERKNVRIFDKQVNALERLTIFVIHNLHVRMRILKMQLYETLIKRMNE